MTPCNNNCNNNCQKDNNIHTSSIKTERCGTNSRQQNIDTLKDRESSNEESEQQEQDS